MKTLTSIVVAGLCSIAAAQTGSLQCWPGAPSQVSYWGYQAASPNLHYYFDLNVLQTVTLQAITTPLLTPVGQIGTLEVWMTNPGITTYVGNHLTAANWSKVAEGQIIGNGTTGSLAALSPLSCQQQIGGGGLVLAPGSRGVAIRYTNCNPLLVATTALQTFANTELSVSGGDHQYAGFAGGMAGPVGVYNGVNYTAWQWRGLIDYAIGVQPHACATKGTYGSGCYSVPGSFYQHWTGGAPAPAAAAALNGRVLTLVPTGAGYLLVQGNAAWIPPSPTATSILAGIDDGEVAINPSQPFVHPGGVAISLYVNSNGFVSVSPQALPGAAPNFIPNPLPMLNATNSAWWAWRDFNVAFGGQILWEEVGTKIVITWLAVEHEPQAVANPTTFQFQFDTATQEVHYVFQTWDAIGGSGFFQGEDTLVGYSPGGISPPTTPIDVTTVSGVNLPHAERWPLTVEISGTPQLGQTISIDTTNAFTTDFGVNFLSLGAQPAPGLDLGPLLGMTDCFGWIDINSMVGNLISNVTGFSMSIVWPLPSSISLAGAQVFTQSAMLEAGINPYGAVASNGAWFILGTY
jgi:hypothetical protein